MTDRDDAIRILAEVAAQHVVTADRSVHIAMMTGDESLVLGCIDDLLVIEDTWTALREEHRDSEASFQKQDEMIKARRSAPIKLPLNSPARQMFNVAAAELEAVFAPYAELLDREHELSIQSLAVDDAAEVGVDVEDESDRIDEALVEIQVDLDAAEKEYRRVLSKHGLNDSQWQAIYNYRRRLAS